MGNMWTRAKCIVGGQHEVKDLSHHALPEISRRISKCERGRNFAHSNEDNAINLQSTRIFEATALNVCIFPIRLGNPNEK
ncbi:hypothetical protein HNY73_010606 [Argiope bruennichi]|uniref:Uncharacterized protein n=1 Tax=Argiope bruennichi TaxID=94029 RepID=A0A8T0F6G5_ARGBR|nr:hypothetical protein HNY73_010606 [Argiope bruennichi]